MDTVLPSQLNCGKWQKTSRAWRLSGLAGTPFSSGCSEREQEIGKDGIRRVRTAMVELAWLWLRWQPDSLVDLVPRASRDIQGSPERHSPAAAASASKRSARTASDACERRWWNSPGCGCAGSPIALSTWFRERV